MKYPDETAELVRLAKKHNLSLLRREGFSFWSHGTRFIEYGDDVLRVRAVLDRDPWHVNVADATRPDDWYDMDILRDFLVGPTATHLLLPEEVRLLEVHWDDLVNAFLPPNRISTHRRLHEFEQERAKRIFPTWSTAALDLESFLLTQGMRCQRREAPEGSIGGRLMLYTDNRLAVRISCGGSDTLEGWCVAIADATQQDTWYDVTSIRHILQKPNEPQMPYACPFTFVVKHWNEIREMFSDSRREATHARLRQLADDTNASY